MKRFLFLCIIIMATTRTGVAFPPRCEEAINQVMQTLPEFKGKNLKQLQADPSWPALWKRLKEMTGFGIHNPGSVWNRSIVPQCCPFPCTHEASCQSCACDGVNPCTWKCKCCWESDCSHPAR
jgi:hypothetical protein